jgi:endonuclease/exonuclease/phosphatase family metal-dependent hydrolase
MPEIISGQFAPFRLVLWRPSSLRIVDWNIDRGQQLAGVIDFLAHTSADMFILQEVDLNAKRTHRLNVAEEIARKLQMNYVFGREFQELVQGSKNDPAYHGQAILAKWPIANPRLIRFSRQSSFWKPHWYLPRMEPFQERLGGRVALVAEVNLAGNRVTVYNLHLESKGGDDLRLNQIQEVLSDVANQGPRGPVIVAGDLNLDASKDSAGSAFAAAGFQNALFASGTPTRPSRRLLEPGRCIDWAFVHGPIKPISAKVHNQVSVSDHYPISLTLALSRT